MSSRCLLCAAPTGDKEEYHTRCSKEFFGISPPPALEISLKNLMEYAARSVLARTTVTGVQKKLSLSVERKGKDARFTIVGLWGSYILKPPVEEYPCLPENEFTVMGLASSVGIPIVPHAMLRLDSGELAYISKRIDRDGRGGKHAMEDFCQVSGRLTEDKYKGSVEGIGKLLRTYSIYPGLDAINLFELVLFNYVCGNADMHLKNFSLIETPHGMRLSPAYDLVSTILAIPDDPEESALTINGKKANLQRRDFEELAESLNIRQAACRNALEKISCSKDSMLEIVRECFLPISFQEKLCDVIIERCSVLDGIRPPSAS